MSGRGGEEEELFLWAGYDTEGEHEIFQKAELALLLLGDESPELSGRVQTNCDRMSSVACAEPGENIG